MGDKGTLWLPEGVSTLAPEIDSLFNFVNLVSLILFIGVVGAMVYFMIRYRRRDASEVPSPVEPNKIVELSWIVLPTILVMVLFNWGFQTFIELTVAPPDSYEVRARAAKWRWEFEYPNGTVTSNELHVPVGRPVRVVMNSVDVLHSFFIPVFRVKQDVLPNRYSSVWFEATRTGEFQIFCTEYCGAQHSGMLAKVVVHNQDDFNAWLESAGVDEDMPLPEYGALLYDQQACVQCHSLDGTPKIGPTFKGLFGKTEQLTSGSVVVDDDYLRRAILEPAAEVVQGYQPVMPPYSSLKDRQVDALIAFIKEQQ